MFVAGSLSLAHFYGTSIQCGASRGCDVVAQHPSSMWGSVPVAVYGFCAYLILATLACLRGIFGLERTRALLLGGLLLSGAGAIVSFYLTYVAIFEIKATCMWCLTSAALMILSFLVHAAMFQLDRDKNRPLAGEAIFAGMLGILMFGTLGFQAKTLSQATPESKLDTISIDQDPLAVLVPKDAHVYGNPQAPITLVEFADLTCGGCRESFFKAKELVDSFNGRVRLVFRHLPWYNQKGHELSLPGAVISEYAAEKGKFWEWTEHMYHITDFKEMSRDDLIAGASEIGLDPSEIQKLFDKGFEKYLDIVHRDRALADRLGLISTPTYIVVSQGTKPKAVFLHQVKNVLNNAPYRDIK